MKKLLALLCALCLLVPIAALAEETGETGEELYPDVPSWEWFTPYIEQVTELGLMGGSDDGLFHPKDPVTRAAVITVLWRREDKPQPESLESFPDVDPEDPMSPSYWYAEAAAWAKEAGIAAGYEDGAFRGSRPVTREELAVFLFKYAQYTNQPIAEGSLWLFPDADKVSDWAEDAIRHTVGMGLIQGNDLGELIPQGVAQRCQLAVILVRMSTPVAG